MELSAFGALVVVGLVLGARLSQRAARTYAPGDDQLLRDIAPWAVVAGFAGAHLLHVLGYHPELLKEEGPLVVLRFWDGLSSTGGVAGALIGMAAYGRIRHVALRPYLDALALGAAPGWAVARLGCALVHDHPGTLTHFPLAVAFPGGARHDLGLYDAFLLGALSAVLYLLARRPRGSGLLMGVLALGYSVPRFFLDFLRAQDLPFSDGRIAGLTPAQYLTVVFAGLGLYLLASTARAT